MKLYTEEQVKQIQQAILCNHKDAIMYANYCLSVTTPIELPTDEEIEESNPFRLGSGNYNASFFHRWQQGAKWMRDKIEGGIK
jgi:hypothetical protein